MEYTSIADFIVETVQNESTLNSFQYIVTQNAIERSRIPGEFVSI